VALVLLARLKRISSTQLTGNFVTSQGFAAVEKSQSRRFVPYLNLGKKKKKRRAGSSFTQNLVVCNPTELRYMTSLPFPTANASYFLGCNSP
jgi:hypothetical protein